MPLDPLIIENLRNSLNVLRDNNRQFAILYVSCDLSFDSFENVYACPIIGITLKSWDDPFLVENWKIIMNQFKFNDDLYPS